jgi:hypothetical protein
MDLRVLPRWVMLCAVAACVVAVGGCETDHPNPAATQPVDLFVPTAMRVHPIFTQVADWTHSGKPDGIEAQLEFTDQFGDPTKASGRVLFELFGYHKESPDPRGRRVGRWVASLDSLAEQRDRWNTTLRTYRFQLDYPAITTSQGYVLTAVFELSNGGRFFDSIVLPPAPVDKTRKKDRLGFGGGSGAE